MSERKRIHLCLAHMSETGLEQKYIKEAFDTNWVVPLGPNIDAFEEALDAFCGQNKKVVALSSGTARGSETPPPAVRLKTAEPQFNI